MLSYDYSHVAEYFVLYSTLLVVPIVRHDSNSKSMCSLIAWLISWLHTPKPFPSTQHTLHSTTLLYTPLYVTSNYTTLHDTSLIYNRIIAPPCARGRQRQDAQVDKTPHPKRIPTLPGRALHSTPLQCTPLHHIRYTTLHHTTLDSNPLHTLHQATPHSTPLHSSTVTRNTPELPVGRKNVSGNVQLAAL